MAKKSPFFSHDMNARHDPRMIAMRSVYGAEGYGIFWALVEMMGEADGYTLDMRKKYSFDAYAKESQCDRNKIASFIEDCINEFELFTSDGEKFWSPSLLRRMEYRDAKSDKARESAAKRWGASESDANASETHSEGNANALPTDSERYAINKTKQKILNTLSEECEESFEKWYAIYPKAGSVRKTAQEKWRTLWKEKKIVMDEVMSGTESYLAHQAHHEYKVCAATVFLNQERWRGDWSITQASGSSNVGKTGRAAYRPSVYQPEVTRVSDEEREFFEQLYNKRP